MPGKKIDKVTRQKIIKYYLDNNLSLDEVSKKFNCSSTSISRILKQNNVELKDTEENLVGQTFNRLTVKSYNGLKLKRRYWDCICSCGNTSIVNTFALKSGQIKSCGCLQLEFVHSRKLPIRQRCINNAISQYKNNASARNIEFHLNNTQIENLIFQNCFYCNNSTSNVFKRKGEICFYNGIDRIDNTIGYFIENCVSCCHKCNYAKSDMSFDNFKEMIKKIYLNLYSKEVSVNIANLVDSLVTTDVKCFFEQEKIMKSPENSPEALAAAKQAQTLNKKRNELMRAINESLGFKENNLTEKTYE